MAGRNRVTQQGREEGNSRAARQKGRGGTVGQCLPQRDRSREETALREPSRLMTVLTFLTELEGMYLAQPKALPATRESTLLI